MTNLTTLATSDLKMTSLEIAGLTGKEHRNVMRDIREMLDDLDELNFELISYRDSMNREKPMYALTRRLTDCLLTGYSAPARMRVIDRWHELERENQPIHQIPQTYAQALTLAASQAVLLEEQAPMVNYYQDFMESERLQNATSVGQHLGISAVMLNRFLTSQNVYNQSVRRYKAFQQWFIDEGFGVVRDTDTGHPQSLFTPSGVEAVIEMYQGINNAN